MAQFSELSGFTPKQIAATQAADAHKFTLYGGSRGPGKSYWLRWYALRLLCIYKEKFNIPNPVVGLFCEDYPTLRDRQIARIEEQFPRGWGQIKSTQVAGLGYYLRGGGMIALRNLDKPDKYQSAEFAAVLVDELTKNDRKVFDVLRGSLRWPGIPPEWIKFAAATNPGSIGHLWVKDYWINGIFPPEMERYRDEFAFVRALPDDNPHLDPEYWDMLDSLPGPLARAWRWGEWDIFAGQVFTEWRRDTHVVEPFEIPEHWIRWRAIDWGYAQPFCCLWLAMEPDSRRMVVYRELYEPGLTDPAQAEKVKARTRESEKIKVTLADPSMWTRQTLEDETRSTADVYREKGVPLKKADNDRLIGKRRVHEALELDEDDLRPGLVVFKTCVNLIRTLPALPYDETMVEDVDTDAEDHAYDALRYALSYKMVPRRPPSPGGDVWAPARRGNTSHERQLEELRRSALRGD